MATENYCGPFVYKTKAGTIKLSYILMPEGRVVNTAAAGATPVWEWQYNLTDHLGNVRVVLRGNSPNTAVVCQENHYYPFGMLMGDIGSTYTNFANNKVAQPYLFGGKEYISDLGLDLIDFVARPYDPSGNHFWTQDPMAELYYQMSPYAYCANNPIIYIDPDGRKLEFADGTSDDYKKQFAATEQYLNEHGAGGILKSIRDNDATIYIAEGNNKTFFSPSNATITWDPNMGMTTNNAIDVSPATLLNHESDHALEGLINPEQKKIDKSTPDAQYGNKEEKRVITGSEQDTAKKLGEIKEGEVTRTNHDGTGYDTKGPTTTESANEIKIKPKKDEENK
jgi:RHS repeat-associated protein